MARFRYAVVLEPVPRGWFDENVGLGHDVATELLGSDRLPLAGGEHLAPGAWYESGELRVAIDSWRQRAETSGRVDFADADGAASVSVRLVSASAPRLVELAGDMRVVLPRGLRWSGAFRGSARIDLERWWHTVGTVRGGGEPSIEGWGRHSLARATFAVTPAVAPDGRWLVTVRGKVRGRGVLGPLAALALLFTRRKATGVFEQTMDAFAEYWNREVPRLLARSPDELRALLAELARPYP